ncbi:MAG TPA: hypothetical protein VK988_14605 [Acidimicrobiales bacterium]|nr:hypothetical protein [Acidimicrobiales bacterium]
MRDRNIVTANNGNEWARRQVAREQLLAALLKTGDAEQGPNRCRRQRRC